MRLETERLILRPPQVQDAEDYFSFCNTDFVMRYNAMTPRTLADLQAWFAGNIDGTLLLILKDTGKVIGEINIEQDSLRYGVNSKELSFFLRQECARQGYMKEALRAVIGYLFETENLDCVASRSFAPNTASLALLRSLGFTQNGIIPHCVKGYQDTIFDDVLHTLFREDFRG